MPKERKRRSETVSSSKARCDSIEEQLERQRQKQQSTAAGSPNESKVSHKVASSVPTHRNSERMTAGLFQYDPIRKRYFPKSIFTSHGNCDPCAQRIRKSTPGDKATGSSFNILENEQLRQWSGSNISMKDVSRIVFRGICLSEIYKREENASQLERMRKKLRDDSRLCYNRPYNPCTERTILQLKCSLEYCSSVHRRNTIVSMILSPTVLARKATIIPNMSTLDDIQNQSARFKHPNPAAQKYNKEANRRKIQSSSAWQVESMNNGTGTSHPGTNTRKSLQWFSLLHPLQTRGDLQVLQNQQLQLNDSNCKLYLQPTAPTFDVLCSDSKSHSPVMPHIATISNNAIFYRTPASNAEGRMAWELERKSNSLHYQGVRLVNSNVRHSSSRNESYDGTLIGCVVHNTVDDRQNFMLYNKNSIVQGLNSDERYSFQFAVNDFRVTHDETLQVAFAHGGDKYIGVTILDIFSGARTGYIALHSEPLCLHFRSNSWKYNVLLGNRDGSVSMLDIRSRDALFADLTLKNGGSFGSATSIRPLKRDDNLVVVKGSFGTCHLIDIRKLSNNIESARHRHSTIMELSLSNHFVHKTKSTRCTGVAVDPSENIAVAPFTGQNGDVHLAIWDVCRTGRLLRTVNLNSSLGRRNSSTGGIDAAFCELSDVITSGFEMVCDKDSETPTILSKGWGLWFKTNLSIKADSAPLVGGSIHHIKF